MEKELCIVRRKPEKNGTFPEMANRHPLKKRKEMANRQDHVFFTFLQEHSLYHCGWNSKRASINDRQTNFWVLTLRVIDHAARACLVQTLEQTCLIKTLHVPCLWHVWLVSWVRDWARHPLVTQADKIGRQALAWRLPGVINAKADMPATQITAHCLLSLILLFCPASISLFNKKKIKWPYPFDVKLFIWTYQ